MQIFNIFGDSIQHFDTHIIENNEINGKPIRYYKNTNDIIVPKNTGQVILANCDNCIIEGLNLSNCGYLNTSYLCTFCP